MLKIISLLIFFSVYGQNYDHDLKTGVYGASMDVSTFTELTLNEDSTFKYYDQFELGENFEYTGKWRVHGKKLILYSSENNTIRPMPTKWRIEDNELVSEKVINMSTGVKRQIVLTFKSA